MRKINSYVKIFVITGLLFFSASYTSFALPVNINKAIEVSEIMYDPAISESGGEWIELYNGTGNTVDLTSLIVSDDGGTTFDSISQRAGFSDITNIPTGSFFVITEKDGTISFSDIYNDSSIFAGVTSSSMSLLNSGEEIVIIDTVDGIKDNGNDIILQDFSYPDITSSNSIFKLSILSADETVAGSFTETLFSPWGTGLGNPGKLNSGQKIGAYPVPEPSTALLLFCGLAMCSVLRKRK